MVLFTKEYFPISVLCHLLLIFRSWSTCSDSVAVVICHLQPSTPVLQNTLFKRAHMRDFYATPKLRSSNCSYDVQIWPLSFAPCLTQLFVPPSTDPSTRPHIQVSDVLVTCRLNFWYYYFHFWVFALRNVVSSRPFSPCSWLDPPNLSRCVRLFLGTYNCSLPVLMCSLTNNLIIHLYIHTCIHTYKTQHIHTHTYIHTHIHTYIHTTQYIHTYKTQHIHTHTHIYTYMHTHIHTYIHTYIHVYISLIKVYKS